MSDTPIEVEATGVETVIIEFAGKSYTFPANIEDADGDVVDAVDDQKISHALRGLLSTTEWAAFKATKPKVRDYAALFEQYAKAIGLVSSGN